MPQMGIQPENRVKKTWGKPVFPVTGPSSIVGKAFYTFFFVHRDQWIIQNYAASAALTHQDQAFSLHTWSYTQVLGDLHHLPAKGPINILQPFF